MADTYPRSAIPEPYQTTMRKELRKIPTWKLQEAYGKLKAGKATGVELVEQNRAYAISAIEEILWERGKLPAKSSHSSKAALMTTEEEWNRSLELTLPLVSTGIGVLSLALTFIALRSQILAQRVYYEDGQYLVSVRYPGQRHELRDFVQPGNADVLAAYSQIGPAPWGLYNFVCQEISYRYDIGEFWQTPSETLARGYGDCEDTSVLLTSLIRAGGTPNCYVALGSLRGYGHAWCQLNGQILETTYTLARPAPDPEHYLAYCLFNDRRVEELWHGALGEVFSLQRNEARKLSLIAEARV